MKVVIVICLVVLYVAMVAAQQDFYDNFFGNGLTPQGRSNGPDSPGVHHSGRFPRQINSLANYEQDRSPGPVLFPQAPAGTPGETSGVVVGASGYGFVPPGTQSI
ncbi:uncharacterized protein [Anabrus simplex]|uniref:uncharacterized protein isoform X2 n=1 Tax=Anabrus simplex TaxID=316456 RepID=UPI0034DCDFC6